MLQNGQTNFKNLAANTERFLVCLSILEHHTLKCNSYPSTFIHICIIHIKILRLYIDKSIWISIKKNYLCNFILKIKSLKKVCCNVAYRYTCSNCIMAKPASLFSLELQNAWVFQIQQREVLKMWESAISRHFLQCYCSIDFDHFYALASDTNKNWTA